MPVLSTRAFFDDNLKRIGGAMAAKTDPEKFNLYMGLAELCDDVKKLSMQVDDIKRKLQGTASW